VPSSYLKAGWFLATMLLFLVLCAHVYFVNLEKEDSSLFFIETIYIVTFVTTCHHFFQTDIFIVGMGSDHRTSRTMGLFD
jgi:hypothetical protein